MGWDVVGGINSEIYAPNENFATKLETWEGETHNIDEARKILVCEKKESWQIPSPKKCTRVVDFFGQWCACFIRKQRIGNWLMDH